jgi:hypothetical protein
VEAVAQFDDEDPDVLGHRHDHLADGCGLGLLGAVVLEAVELRHPVDQERDLLAELGDDVLETDLGVLDGVMQESGYEGGLVQSVFGEDGRHRHRDG